MRTEFDWDKFINDMAAYNTPEALELERKNNIERALHSVAVRRAEVWISGEPPSRTQWPPEIPQVTKDAVRFRAKVKDVGYVCEGEGCEELGGLVFHHRHYRCEGHELPVDLLLLCETCHCQIHNYSRFWITPDDLQHANQELEQ